MEALGIFAMGMLAGMALDRLWPQIGMDGSRRHARGLERQAEAEQTRPPSDRI